MKMNIQILLMMVRKKRMLTIPNEPTRLGPHIPPPGYRVKLVPQNDSRPFIKPRLQLVHTNAAQKEGSIESSWNHAAAGGGNTIPQFQVDRDGDSAMLLELNRLGIHSYRANGFCIGYETADRGSLTDPYPTGSPFTEPQVQMIAVGIAYCSQLYDIPIAYPKTWDGTGVACHTEPFTYPYWTKYQGKSCPGNTKKTQMKSLVMPHAQRILNAWNGVTPTPIEPPELPPPPTYKGMSKMLVMKIGGTPTSNWGGWYSYDGGVSRNPVANMAHAGRLVDLGALDAKTNQRVTSRTWADVSHTTSVAELDKYLTPYG